MTLHGRWWLAGLIFAAATLSADTVTLQNGKKVEGTFLGGNTSQIDFLATSGQSLKIQIDTLKSLNFTTASTKAPASSSQAAARQGVLIPAGTTFRPIPERRWPVPGSRIIGPLLASAMPAPPDRSLAGKRRSMGIARTPVNSAPAAPGPPLSPTCP